jgi:hypothetical protein
MLTTEYRKSWASYQKYKNGAQTKLNFKPKQKPIDKQESREQLAAITTMILITALCIALVIAFISNF